MQKLLFSVLLLANVGFFSYRHGYLEGLLPSGREPARIGNQLNADKLKLVPPVAKKPETPAPDKQPDAAPDTKPEPAAAPVAAREPEPPACAEIGDFNPEEAKRFNAQLAAFNLSDQAVRRPLMEVSSYIVYIPPQPDKEAVERKTAELRRLGVNDFFIILDNSPLRWGISLGVFKQESAARTHLDALSEKGVRSARIGQRMTLNGLVAFQLRKLDAQGRSALEKIKASFAEQQVRDCQG
jgi:hypothetical protein